MTDLPRAPRSGGPLREGGIEFASVVALLLGVVALLWGSAYIFIREGIVLGTSPIQ